MARKSRVNTPLNTNTIKTFLWRVAIYLRLSVEDGDDVEQNSIGNQKKICMAYMDALDNMELVDIYVDHGYSGMSYDRPDFQRMYDDIMSGAVNCVIVKDVSRFGRHFIITSEYLQKTFPDMGVRFVAINDDYDSLNPDADVEGLLLPFKMILNDAYVKDISKKIRSSITAKMNTGEYLPSSSSVPFGYIRNPEMSTFDVDEETAPSVVRLYELRAEGLRFNTIAKRMNEEGIPSPGKIRYVRGISADERFSQAEWTRGTIRKILSDPVYIGNRVHGKIKRDRLGADKTRRDRSEWQIIENAHRPIIPEDLFYAVQEVNAAELERFANYQKRDDVPVNYRDIFRNKLFCGDCGARMIGLKRNQRVTSDKAAVIFYQCNGYSYSNKTTCFNHYTRQDLIVDALLRVFNQQLEVAADIEAAFKAHKPGAVSMTSAEADLLQSIRVKRKNIEARIERLLIDLTDGLLRKDEYEYTKAKYNAERDKLLAEERKMEVKVETAKESLNAARKWLDNLMRYKRIEEIDKELVDILVKRILVYRNNVIHVELNYSDPYKEFAVLFENRTAVNAS